MKFIKLLAFFIFISGIISGIWIFKCESYLKSEKVNGTFHISKGDGHQKIYNTLFMGKNTPVGLKVYFTRMKYAGTNLHYGYYKAENFTYSELMTKISKGKQTLIKVTIPEGYNMYEIANVVDRAKIVSKQELLKTFTDRQFVLKLTGNSYESLEGFLAPGTYMFEKKYPADKVAKAMVEEFYRTLPENFENKANTLGLSFYEALTLASIIQKETYSELEAPLVSSVFHNRIKKRMLLQADPTIIYGIFPQYEGKISRAHLNDAGNRYNTYKHKGLTPTPISNPSAMVLNAVLNPADTKYLYFVATQDRKHLFAETYEEHSKNVRIHQLGLSK